MLTVFGHHPLELLHALNQSRVVLICRLLDSLKRQVAMGTELLSRVKAGQPSIKSLGEMQVTGEMTFVQRTLPTKTYV